MFERIRYVRDYGVFSDFDATAVTLPDFKERNLIYGWNYSGKTTLSRVFRSFEKEAPHNDFTDGTFKLLLQDGDKAVGDSDLSALPFRVRVFNSDYVRENLSWREGVEPILLVGEESIQLEKRLSMVDSWLARRKDFVDEVQTRKEEIRSYLKEEATRVARRVRKEFGVTPFKRAPHLENVISEMGSEYPKYIMCGEDRKAANETAIAEKREEVERLQTVPSVEALYTSSSKVLEKTPDQDVIERLKKDRAIESWVGDGISLHEESDHCHFCNRSLPTGLLRRLRGHFSKGYRELEKEVRDLIENAESSKIDLELPPSAKLYPRFREQYENRKSEVREAETAANAEIAELISQLRNKLTRISEELSLSAPRRYQDRAEVNSAINDINRIISQHNEQAREHEESREAALRALIRHEIATYLDDTDYYRRRARIEELSTRESRWRNRIEDLREDRSNIQKRLSDEVKGAEAINRYMSLYFGSKQIQVAVNEDDRYVLKRGDHQARNLSEGERTAIAFSYFCVSLEERDASIEDTVIYIDDPVSSLDSNHLFNTYSLIKRIGSNCNQLFISTHNYEFFRICKEDSFFREVVRGNKRASWYLLRRTSRDESELVDLPKMLRKYNSEYHYLFDLAYKYSSSPERFDHLTAMMPNILRKILETYTSFRFPNTAMNQRQRLERLMSENEVVCNQVYKFINYGSHSDSMGYGREFPQSPECKQVIDNTFTVLKREDPQHFKGMIALCE